MKKILLILLLFVFAQPSFAEVFKCKAIQTISTANPSNTIQVKTVSKINIDGIEIKKNYILIGEMKDITEPQQWHHNASFTFIPTSYIDTDNIEHKFQKEIKATYRQKLKPDFRNSEITFGDFAFSPGYIPDTVRVFKGEGKDVVNDYVNRSTPWGKGLDINIKQNEVLYFNFPEP